MLKLLMWGIVGYWAYRMFYEKPNALKREKEKQPIEEEWTKKRGASSDEDYIDYEDVK